MSQMKCEICGCSSFTKQDAFVVCDSCGTRYSIEEVKRLMGNVKAEKTVQAAPQNGPKAQLINNAFQLLRLGNYPESFRAFKTVTEEYPEDFRGWGNLLWLLVCKGYCCKRGMDTCNERFCRVGHHTRDTCHADGGTLLEWRCIETPVGLRRM